MTSSIPTTSRTILHAIRMSRGKLRHPTTNIGQIPLNWLNMMYPRLKIARDILAENGFIFISIDDREVSNLRKICDEIFGENHFVIDFLWKKKGTTSNVKGAEASSLVDHTLVYKKSKHQDLNHVFGLKRKEVILM